MPKKLYPSEPARIFEELHREVLQVDKDFVLLTADPTCETFAAKLIEQHYPAQVQLPLD